MIGLIILVVGVIYLVLLVWATRAAYRWAKGKGLSRTRCRLAGAGGFLVVYLPVFWDHIPTLVAHHYYCSTEAGFWEYKTLDQWKAENPGVAETLVASKGAPSKREGDMQNYTDTYFLNQRFNWVVQHNGKFLFNRWRHEQGVVDAKSGEVLARYIDFSTAQEQRQAGWAGWKMWLDSRHCSGGAVNGGRLSTFMEATNYLGEKGKMK
jgi:hypothetical protein